MIQKVAIQGIQGSFHDQLVEQYYTQAPELMGVTFDSLAKAVVSGGCDQAVMALENSITQDQSYPTMPFWIIRTSYNGNVSLLNFVLMAIWSKN